MATSTVLHLARVAALMAACAALSACGGGDAEAPPPPTSSGTPTPAPAPDTTPPTVTIASDVSAPLATGPVTFTFVFDEDVGTSFDAGDVQVTGGTAGTFTRVTGSEATLVVTPSGDSGTITVTVGAGSFSDLAGNASTAGATMSKDFALGPATAAPVPPARAAGDVRSVYSDAYTQIAGVNLFPDWGQSTVVSEVAVAGDHVQKYATLNYEGIDWASNPIDVSGMSALHVDLWSGDTTSVKVSLISAGLENPVTVTLTPNAWNSVDIDLAQYTAADKTAVIQLKFEGVPAGGTLFLDNVYFWRPAASGGTLTFSSGFAGGNLTNEGGGVFAYSGSNLDGWSCTGGPGWCGSGSGGTGATSYFYTYYQTPSPASGAYVGLGLMAPGVAALSTTGDTAGVTIAGQTMVDFTFNDNPEWAASSTPNFGVILTLGRFYDVGSPGSPAPCNIKLLSVVAPLNGGAATAYSLPLSGFQVIQACNSGVTTAAQALAISPVSAIDFQGDGGSAALPAVGGLTTGVNTDVPTGSPAVYPTTLALTGGITFH